MSDSATKELSPEQQHVLNLVKNRQSVFFTGPAGTGKSFLLGSIIGHLEEIGLNVAVTASTGMAALNIKGKTLHSFAGIGLGKDPPEKLLSRIEGNIGLKLRWRATHALIIDEISMIDAALFDKVEYIARKIRENENPFGGIQLIITGDFFQLPPVPDSSFNHGKNLPRFAFEAKTWMDCIERPTFLTHVFRQSDDTFIRILGNMRRGILAGEDIELLKGLSRPLNFSDDIEPVELFPVRQQVDNCNRDKLDALPDPQHIYYAMDCLGDDIDHIPIPKKDADAVFDRIAAPAIALLKIGAQVMLLQNINNPPELSEKLVNGSLGKVIEFISIEEAVKRNIPRAGEDPNRPTSVHAINASSRPKANCRPMTGHMFSQRQVWPVIHFPNRNKDIPGLLVLVTPLRFTALGFSSNLEGSRVQLPLTLAWAMSIHKSQGQTLPRVKVDLGRSFEKGQVYVAISRATSMTGLQISNFQPELVVAHPRVIEWQYSWVEEDGATERQRAAALAIARDNG